MSFSVLLKIKAMLTITNRVYKPLCLFEILEQTNVKKIFCSFEAHYVRSLSWQKSYIVFWHV